MYVMNSTGQTIPINNGVLRNIWLAPGKNVLKRLGLNWYIASQQYSNTRPNSERSSERLEKIRSQKHVCFFIKVWTIAQNGFASN